MEIACVDLKSVLKYEKHSHHQMDTGEMTMDSARYDMIIGLATNRNATSTYGHVLITCEVT